MLLLVLYIFLFTTQPICSYVIEQDEDMTDLCSKIDYEKFCKPIGACSAGSHVMCMYYKPDKLMGPKCIDGRMVRLSKDSKEIILNRINGVRRQIAQGIALGDNDVYLPRGYSMFKVKWDTRLALFAQVWANQCRFTRDDQCRATKRFANPGQFMGTFRYTMPEWRRQDDLNKTGPLGKQCLTESKVKLAVASSLDMISIEKHWASRALVMQYSKSPINHYLMMAYGKITHVGCGMSAYKDYHWSEDLRQYEFFYLELVCNLSAQPAEAEQLYNIDREKLHNSTKKCGCPPGYVEDESCLCVHHLDADKENLPNTKDDNNNEQKPNETIENGGASKESNNNDDSINTDKLTTTDDDAITSDANADVTTPGSKTKTTPIGGTGEKKKYGWGDTGGSKKPTVLILPIITIDDAPADIRQNPWKLDSEGNSSRQFSPDNLNDIINQQMKYQNITSLQYNPVDYENSQDANQSASNAENSGVNNNLQSHQNSGNLGLGSNDTSPIAMANKSSRKSSIFSRVAPFDLSNQNYDKKQDNKTVNSDTLNKNLKRFLKEVPKKDLSRLEELFLKFIIKKHSQATDTPNEIRVNSMESSLIRPVKSYHEGNGANALVPNAERFVTKEFKPQNRRMGNLIQNTGNIVEIKDGKPLVPIKTKDEDVIVTSKSQFDMPIIRKQSPIVSDKYRSNTYYGNKNDPDRRLNGYYNSVKTDNGWVNNARSMSNFGNNADAKSKYVNENERTDELKLKRTLYLHNEINKLKSKLKHLRQYAHQNSVVDEHFRPLVQGHDKLDRAKNFYRPDRG